MPYKIPEIVVESARNKFLEDYKKVLPFGNASVPNFGVYLEMEYALWYDKKFLYAMGVQQ